MSTAIAKLYEKIAIHQDSIDEIKDEIKKLEQIELQEPTYEVAKNCKHTVGFFDTSFLEELLQSLHHGDTYVIKHSSYTTKVQVKMNGQRNRFILTDYMTGKDYLGGWVTEETLLNYMIRYPTSWYKINS